MLCRFILHPFEVFVSSTVGGNYIDFLSYTHHISTSTLCWIIWFSLQGGWPFLIPLVKATHFRVCELPVFFLNFSLTSTSPSRKLPSCTDGLQCFEYGILTWRCSSPSSMGACCCLSTPLIVSMVVQLSSLWESREAVWWDKQLLIGSRTQWDYMTTCSSLRLSLQFPCGLFPERIEGEHLLHKLHCSLQILITNKKFVVVSGN